MIDLFQMVMLIIGPLAGLTGQLQAERVAEDEGIAVENARQRRGPFAILGLAIAVWACQLPFEAMVPACILGWLLSAVVAVDVATMLLPRSLTYSLIASGLAITWWQHPELLAYHALGAAIGWSSFRLVALFYQLMRGRPGLGLGDAVLLAGAGAWVGPAALPGLVFLAAGSGLVVAMSQRLAGRGEITFDRPLPFGPPLALSIWITWAIGPIQLA